jgi:hypothetical protein
VDVATLVATDETTVPADGDAVKGLLAGAEPAQAANTNASPATNASRRTSRPL